MLDDDLFQAGYNKNRLTRGQKREGRRRWRQEHPLIVNPRHPLDISRRELQSMQQKDETLQPLFRSAESTKDGEDPFFLKDDILYRLWSPQSSEDGGRWSSWSSQFRVGGSHGTSTFISNGRPPWEEEDGPETLAEVLLANPLQECGALLQKL